ncbi:MAG: lytic murein transglycosylase [Rickettsiales bacterium]|jgi:membrane-bound lytic murein transglycosylase B|nr:lytic murein transglycosylase [Rickettsiales bacterium]
MFIKKLSIALLFLFVNYGNKYTFASQEQQISSYNSDDSIDDRFLEWLNDFKDVAQKQHGIKKEVIEMSLSNAKFNKKIIELDKKQPEFRRTFLDYYKKKVNKDKMLSGRKQIKKYEKILNKVEKKYKVSKYIIVAFWEMETGFGKNMGKMDIVNSIANLAFDERRRKFFTEELIYALKIIQKKHVKLEKFKGSWAGAFGNFQFMPSTFMGYAVDGDKNGKIDLYNSVSDSLYSAGNFLSKIGWNNKQKWGRVVTINKDDEELWGLVNSKEWMDFNYFVDKNVKNYDGKKMRKIKNKIQAKLIAPMGKDGPIFLIYENFKVFLRWNNSVSYALSVGLLSDAYFSEKALNRI